MAILQLKRKKNGELRLPRNSSKEYFEYADGVLYRWIDENYGSLRPASGKNLKLVQVWHYSSEEDGVVNLIAN